MTDRLPHFDAAAATPEQKTVLDEILSGPRGNLNGPFLGWIRSPELAQHAQRLGAFCRYQTGLPLRLSELAILVTAARWQAQAEWYIHYPIALQAGVREEDAQVLLQGKRPAFADADDALIYAFASELYDAKRVSDATYAQTVERFGHTVTINLVALLGYYALVAMTLNVFDMRAQGQATLPFAE
ncbi:MULTISPECIES: carboxymuconolactone decarboxylase family protein [Paraburkholderia]|uniref:carboxymuconolactone decarboxylase family protein n=1 Tax=Paraburkholderia TaxID=1822464 RepID=UPI00224F26F3|nr:MULTISPECIES: carboxymuconolactone decarboxylase family protein [Paraburkholderia]MCX4161369.1 carboxymuconolactone decarboxylase family protein [Paraburkholderia megapolitana]MDN7156865.1 carboxymuconolactone decarboxylase family protein [Paraburkholderia sp. CHISQ3]MDQ6493910.1 carboxymuconolactone decarboxylase family protein [Paraburkholderia megapolitana]